MEHNTSHKTILVIEDEVPLLEAVTFKLKQRGFSVHGVKSGEEGLEVLETETPDLVWLDVLLPGMNGLSMLEHLRETERGKNIPVVVVSVSGGPDKVSEAKSMGALDYIVKSDHDIAHIVDRVAGIMNKLT